MSVINAAKSVLLGRTTIGIAGVVSDGGATVSLDVTSAFSSSYNVTHPKYPVEEDVSRPGYVVDHVVQGDMTLSITGILADNVNPLTAAIESASLPMSSREKLRKLIQFQREGAIITVLGYGTDKLKVMETLAHSLAGDATLLYKTGPEADPVYMGTHREEITNLIVGNVQVSGSTDNGNDIEVTISLSKVFFASPAGQAASASAAGAKQTATAQADVGATAAGKAIKIAQLLARIEY